jgi:hypothetical protein
VFESLEGFFYNICVVVGALGFLKGLSFLTRLLSDLFELEGPCSSGLASFFGIDPNLSVLVEFEFCLEIMDRY